jgi:hypothetical protein
MISLSSILGLPTPALGEERPYNLPLPITQLPKPHDKTKERKI